MAAPAQVTMGAARDITDEYFAQTASIIGDMAGVAPRDEQYVAQLTHEFVKTYDTVHSGVLYGLLPFCFTLLVLHELYQSSLNGSPFGARKALLRMGAGVGAYLCYPYVLAIIFRIAGGGDGGWMDLEQVGGIATDARINPFNNPISDIGLDAGQIARLLMAIGVWVIVMLCVLFAFIVGAVLSLVQSTFITILIMMGPICIAVSVVPGVGVAKSWARALAMTLAWSILAGVITQLMMRNIPNLGWLMNHGDLAGLLKAAAQFVIFGLCTACVPMLTSKIMAGAAPAASGVAGALLMGVAGAKVAASLGGKVAGGAKDGAVSAGRRGGAAAGGVGAGEAFAAGTGGEQGLRPHKVGMIRRGVGAVVGAALSPATMLAGAGGRALVGGSARPAGGAAAGRGAPGVDAGGKATNVAGRASAPPGAASATDPVDRAMAHAGAAKQAAEAPVNRAMVNAGSAEAAGEAPADRAMANAGSTRVAGEAPVDRAMANAGAAREAAEAPADRAGDRAAVIINGARAGAPPPARLEAAQQRAAGGGAPPAPTVAERGGANNGLAPSAAAANDGRANSTQPAPPAADNSHVDNPGNARPADKAVTARHRPFDAPTPLVLEPKVSRHVVRHPKTEPMPAPLREGGEEEDDA